MNKIDIFLNNKELNKYEIEEGKIVLESKPLTMRIILTNLCNIKCIMCDIYNQKDKFSIPYEKIIEIEDFLPYLERIDWQGGEVFLVDYFKELLMKISSYSNITQTIQTNGLLLNEDWIELLLKHNISLLISIDGVTKETYEYIRKNAKFEDLLKNINLYNKLKNKYNSKAIKLLCVCIMRSNYLQLNDFVDFAIRYDFKHISFGFIHGDHIPPEENIFNPIDTKAIRYLKEQVLLVKERCEKNNIILECQFEPFLKDNKDNFIKNYSIHKRDYQDLICNLPWTNLTIDAIRKGNVYPECLCSKSIGNIMYEKLIEIWNGDLMQEYRMAILEKRYRDICSKYCFRIL